MQQWITQSHTCFPFHTSPLYWFAVCQSLHLFLVWSVPVLLVVYSHTLSYTGPFKSTHVHMMSLKIIFSFSKKTQLHVHCNQTLIYNFNYYQNLNTLHFVLFLIDTQISKNKTKITSTFEFTNNCKVFAYLEETYFSYISSRARFASSSSWPDCCTFSSAYVHLLVRSDTCLVRYSLSCFSKDRDCLAADS